MAMHTERDCRGGDRALVSLLVRLRDADDERDWGRFISEQGALLRTMVRDRLKRDDLVEDGVQDALVALRRSLPRFTPGSDAQARSWIRRIVHGIAGGLQEAETARHRRERKYADQQDRRRRSVPREIDQERADLVRRAVYALPEAQRRAVELRHLYGFSTAAVAERLGCSEEAVRRNLHRALASLRQRLGWSAGPAALLFVIGDLQAGMEVLGGSVAVVDPTVGGGRVRPFWWVLAIVGLVVSAAGVGLGLVLAAPSLVGVAADARQEEPERAAAAVDADGGGSVVVHEIALPEVRDVRAFACDGERVYLYEPFTGIVIRGLAPPFPERRLAIPAGRLGRVDGLAHDGRRLWSMDTAARTLTVIDPDAGRIERRVPWPDEIGEPGQGHRLWLAADGRGPWLLHQTGEGRTLYGLAPETGAVVVRRHGMTDHREGSPPPPPGGVWFGEPLYGRLALVPRGKALGRYLDPRDGSATLVGVDLRVLSGTGAARPFLKGLFHLDGDRWAALLMDIRFQHRVVVLASASIVPPTDD